MGKKTTESKLQYMAEYYAANSRQYKISLSNIYDRDLIEYLDGKENKQGTIKAALREYMKNENKI